MISGKCSALAIGFVTLCAAAPSASAQFLLIDDFETRTPGDIDEQGDWNATGAAYLVVADPEAPGNAVLRAQVASDEAWHPLAIADGTTRTMFFRVRINVQQNISWGLSDIATPTEINDFEIELNMANAAPDLRANDDGFYAVIATLAPNTWYNTWILADNQIDRFDVYLHDRGRQDATDADLIVQGLTFRNGGAGDLRSLFLKTGGGNSQDQGPFYLDDIYLSSAGGLDLTNPAVCPADVNGDGEINTLDVVAYLNLWAAADPLADFDWNQIIDTRDLLQFLNAWVLGCD